MELRTFSRINLGDPFFDSLKVAYTEFTDWYNRKASEGAQAYVQYDNSNNVIGFLYLKVETGALSDINPSREAKRRLKVGTFKVNPHGTKFGERFIKKIMDKAIVEDVDEAYVTVFDEHDALITLLQRYGFINAATKTTPNGTEQVLIKDMRTISEDIYIDYPLLKTEGKRKFALSIKPEFHIRLFPDSILNNENYSLIEDVSETNSIHKVYICFMDLSSLEIGDILAIYRIKAADDPLPAYYRSVVTSICLVEDLKTRNDFNNLEEFIAYTSPYSVFSEAELTTWYNSTGRIYVIKMTYNIALNKRVINGQLRTDLGINPKYWGFFSFNDTQFNRLLELGEVYENIIIN